MKQPTGQGCGFGPSDLLVVWTPLLILTPGRVGISQVVQK